MTENINIACAIGNCSNPVIGQCRSCGRYYCANHNVEGLCSDCAYEKAKKELVADYFQTAEKVKRETDKGYTFTKVAIGMQIGVFACFGLFGSFLAVTEGVEFKQAFGMLLLLSLVIGFYLLLLRFQNSLRLKRALKKATEVDKSKPDFLEFYRAWDSKKPTEEIIEALHIGKRFAADLAGKAINSAINEK